MTISKDKPFTKLWAWQALEKWGVEAQIDMAIEELSELILAILHYPRGKSSREDIIEEIADVLLMIEQLREIFLIPQSEIDKIGQQKLIRLMTLIEGDG